LLVLVLAIAACGGVGGADLPSTTTSEATADRDSGVVAPDVTTTTVGDQTTTTNSRPPAPDFTLGLGGGGSYTLSKGEKPVYLVFWAEW
jgi:hypothetical protein